MKKIHFLLPMIAIFSCLTEPDIGDIGRDIVEFHYGDSTDEVSYFDDITQEIYEISDSNQYQAYLFADSLLKYDNNLDEDNRNTIMSITGELLYEIDSIDMAYTYFIEIANYFDSPRNKINKAACLIAQNNLDKGYSILIDIKKKNNIVLWHMGNYYEMIGENDRAIESYKELYEINPPLFPYCIERIDTLNKGSKPIQKIQLQHNKYGQHRITITPI